MFDLKLLKKLKEFSLNILKCIITRDENIQQMAGKRLLTVSRHGTQAEKCGLTPTTVFWVGADFLFAPTVKAISYLEKEGISGNQFFFSGDVMYDASLLFGKKAEEKSDLIKGLGLVNKDYVLATVHKAENTSDRRRLINSFKLLSGLSQEFSVVFPLHPRTAHVLENDPEVKKLLSGVRIIKPVGYLDMLMLEKNAQLVATDSGGVQKEAFFFKVPCLTLRDETEWVELIDLGWNTVLSPKLDLDSMLTMAKASFGKYGKETQPYGEGDAGEIICERLLNV